MKKFTVLLGLALLVAAPRAARAQDALAALESAVGAAYQKAFGESIPMLLEANAKLTEAKGNKLAADSLRALAEDARKGASKPDAKAAEKLFTQTSANADAMAAEYSAQGAAVSKEQKAAFIEGAVMYFKGTKSTVELSTQVAPLTAAISGASGIRNPMQLRKAMSLLSVAKMLASGIPQVGKANVTAASALKAYVTANKIEIPAAQMSW